MINQDEIQIYLKDVRKSNVLTPAEEERLTRLVKEGDPDAEAELIKANLRFVLSIAKNYQGVGVDLPDLVSEGNIGLVIAARKFDPTKGFKFISYAVWWIRQSIIQCIHNHGRTIRLPVNVLNDIQKMKKYGEPGETHNHPTATSLNAYIGDSDEDELIQLIEDDNYERPDNLCMKAGIDLNERLRDMIETLRPREKDIISLYFGLNGDPQTLEEIGNKYKLTKERIRQIKDKGLRRLRNASADLYDLMFQ